MRIPRPDPLAVFITFQFLLIFILACAIFWMYGCASTPPPSKIVFKDKPVFVPEPGPELEPCVSPEIRVWQLMRVDVEANPSLFMDATMTDIPDLLDALEACDQQVRAYMASREEVVKKRAEILRGLEDNR